MKPGEAINIIKSNRFMWCDDTNIMDAIDSAIKSLEKQMSMKPIKIKQFATNRCPVCECEVETDENCMGYCDYCGQKLDWSKI